MISYGFKTGSDNGRETNKEKISLEYIWTYNHRKSPKNTSGIFDKIKIDKLRN